MNGFDNPKVDRLLIGHVRTLKECVEIACRRENVSLAYTSRFDCYGIRCNGDEEACWLLPSFKNPTLLFARLHRGIPVNKDEASKKGNIFKYSIHIIYFELYILVSFIKIAPFVGFLKAYFGAIFSLF